MRKIDSDFWIISKLLVISLLFFQACSAPSQKDPGRPEGKKEVIASVETFRNDSLNCWGYEIRIDGKAFIHQETIPALEGEKRFETREDALKVGKAVLKKMSKTHSPTLTREEILKLLPEQQ